MVQFDTSINSLLDIGCGTGLELASIYQKFPNVKITGIDLSKDMLEKLRVKYADTFLIRAGLLMRIFSSFWYLPVC